MSGIAPSERMERARAAQKSWSSLTVAQRCSALGALRQRIASQCEHIAEVIADDTGKPALDALAGDVLVTLEQLRYYERHAPRILRTRKIGKPALLWAGARFEESYKPHGVALICGPSNYPFQLSLVPALTALIAGNAVVLKCSEKTPHTAACIAQLCAEAGLPDDILQVFSGEPASARALIDAGPDIVFFTGSSANGRAVARRAAERLIPCVLELGGKDAALVFADCHRERALDGITYGAFSNAGQVCVGVKRLYLQRPVFDSFLEGLLDRVGRLRIGAGKEADIGVMRGPEARARLRDQVMEAVSRGARIVYPRGGTVTGEEPVVLCNVPADAWLMVEETFGPVLCVAAFDSETEAIALANASEFALSASVWTADLRRGRRIAAQLTAGTCAVNDVIRNIANPHAAFGGNQASGYGRYHGPEGLRAFSRIQSVMVASGRSRRERAWFPFSAKTFRQLAQIIRLRHRPSGWPARLSRWIFPAVMALILPLALGAQADADLRIDVTLPANSHGDVGYLVFASKDGFPAEADKAVRRGFAAAPPGAANVVIDAGTLPPGTYAVAVYQDVNGNHKLDHGLLGIPKEPVGASNNPRPHMGPPTFKDSAFTISNSDKTISIVLVH